MVGLGLVWRFCAKRPKWWVRGKEGGFDTLSLPGRMADFALTRVGEMLSIWSDALEFGVQIDGHFTESGRVEMFQFSDGTLPQSDIDSLAGPAVVRLADYFDPQPLPEIVPIGFAYVPPLQID